MPIVNDERLIEACWRHRHVSGREWRHCPSPPTLSGNTGKLNASITEKSYWTTTEISWKSFLTGTKYFHISILFINNYDRLICHKKNGFILYSYYYSLWLGYVTKFFIDLHFEIQKSTE